MDYTTHCLNTVNSASGTIATDCYNPVNVQIFFLLDFVFFIFVLIVVGKLFKYLFKI